jgi:hypothetical protein
LYPAVESLCARFYAPQFGRPSLTPGIYFRSLLIGYFEGIGAERGIAWRLADSLALRRFVGIALDEYTPDHSTISRTRRLIDLDTTLSLWPRRLQSGRPIRSRWRPLCGENLHDRLQKVTGGLEQTSELYARSLPCACLAYQP